MGRRFTEVPSGAFRNREISEGEVGFFLAHCVGVSLKSQHRRGVAELVCNPAMNRPGFAGGSIP